MCGMRVHEVQPLVPLLTQANLRLWTHLVTDLQTARELLEAADCSAADDPSLECA